MNQGTSNVNIVDIEVSYIFVNQQEKVTGYPNIYIINASRYGVAGEKKVVLRTEQLGFACIAMEVEAMMMDNVT